VVNEDRIPTEHEEQREVVRWFRQTWPGVLIYATPNGGKRDMAQAARLKAEGVVPGIPDLCIPAWRLYIEMKRAKGGVTTYAQKSVMMYLRGAGYDAMVCAGAEQAKRMISSHATNLGVKSDATE
jgi:hypothetical protein